jgi:hypothetical protein
MKLQTAKVLWQEERKEAAFLVLESINDVRADDLRSRMGFDDTYEIGQNTSSGISWTNLGIVLVIVMVVSFLLGNLVDFGGTNPAVPEFVREGELLVTRDAPTIEAEAPATQSLVELTGTANHVLLTQNALEHQQGNSMSWLDATETARYEQATATENARATAVVGQ